ncbi:hypothetical protein EWI30_06135 [Enterobacter cloacae]|nr:hypothetical protein EWI30_06135 [Enterobacter cloacae]
MYQGYLPEAAFCTRLSARRSGYSAIQFAGLQDKILSKGIAGIIQRVQNHPAGQRSVMSTVRLDCCDWTLS